MRHAATAFSIIFFGSVFLTGCISLSKYPGFNEVESSVEDRTGFTLDKRDDAIKDKLPEIIGSLAEGRLELEEAVEIALLNNYQLQATFQELGIVKADLLEAGLLKNPRFRMSVRFPEEGVETNTEFSITQDFLDLLYLPLRRRVASARFEQAKMRVADAVLNLIAEVKTAYYSVQAAEQNALLQKTVLESSEAAVELSARQLQAGNIKALDHVNEQAAGEQARLEFAQAETAVLSRREALIRLLGLTGAESWEISPELPDLPSSEPPLEDLEEQALSQRLDLAAVRKETEIFRKTLLASRVGIIQDSEIGISSEKDPDGTRVTGPEFGTEIPIFNWQQGASSRNKALLNQSRYGVAAFEIQVRSEVREARNKLLLARATAESYRDNLIPARAEIVRLMQLQYNYMLEGVYELLLVKQNEINAHRHYIESLKEYWISRAELERSLGNTLPVPAKAAKPQTETTAEETRNSHEHH